MALRLANKTALINGVAQSIGEGIAETFAAEGVIWDRQTTRFWWADIEARRLYRYGHRRQHVSSQVFSSSGF